MASAPRMTAHLANSWVTLISRIVRFSSPTHFLAVSVVKNAISLRCSRTLATPDNRFSERVVMIRSETRKLTVRNGTDCISFQQRCALVVWERERGSSNRADARSDRFVVHSRPGDHVARTNDRWIGPQGRGTKFRQLQHLVVRLICSRELCKTLDRGLGGDVVGGTISHTPHRSTCGVCTPIHANLDRLDECRPEEVVSWTDRDPGALRDIGGRCAIFRCVVEGLGNESVHTARSPRVSRMVAHVATFLTASNGYVRRGCCHGALELAAQKQ